MFKQAVILAGGLGTRLRPYTIVIPKPLVPLGEYPILEIVIRQLVNQRFDKITIAVNHHAPLIKAYFGDGSKWGIPIEYSCENKPLGTVGPLMLIENLPDNFLVMNGDILTDFNYHSFYHHHIASDHELTLACCQREEKSEFGVIEVDNNRLVGFKEKPILHSMVSMGIYMLHKAILDLIPMDAPFGFDQLLLNLINKKRYPGIFTHDGMWLDIGRQDDYVAANTLFESRKASFFI